MRNELEGLVEPVGAEKHKTRRKKEGAFYTPSFITRYIIEQALGGVIRETASSSSAPLQSPHRGLAKQAARRSRAFTTSMHSPKAPRRP